MTVVDLNPANRQPWTAERVAILQDLYSQRRTLGDIARTLGLSSASSAYSAVRKYCGHTPRRYQRGSRP